MKPAPLTYSDVIIKQCVEHWAEGLNFDPEEQIFMLLEDKFGVARVTIEDARPERDCLMLKIRTDLWKQPREFGLLKCGSLAW